MLRLVLFLAYALALPIKQYTFDVAFTIVYTNDVGNISDERINQQMSVLNADYEPAQISFRLVNVTRVQAPWNESIKSTYKIGGPTTLNVYTHPLNGTASLGKSSTPSKYHTEPQLDGVEIRHSVISGGSNPNYNIGHTLTHETGHWLGLLHIFQGGCNDPVGDNVDDTPPSASASEGCPVGRNSCGDIPDLIHNFMDYSYDACMESFTPGQIRRMHETIRAFRSKQV